MFESDSTYVTTAVQAANVLESCCSLVTVPTCNMLILISIHEKCHPRKFSAAMLTTF